MVEAVRGEVVRDIVSFKDIGAEWDSLWERSGVGWTWLTHEWLMNWWASFASEARPLVPVVWAGDRLVAAAPMMIVNERVKRMGCRVLRFMQNALTPRSQFLLDAENGGSAVDLWELLESCSGVWDLAILENIPHDEVFGVVWKSDLAGTKLRFEETPNRQSPYVDLSDGYQGFLASISPKMRENIRASRNRLARLGDIDVRRYLGSGDLPGALEECFDISARSWKGKDGCDLGRRPSYRSFYQALAGDEFLRQRLYVWILKLEGRSVAFSIVIRSGQVVTGLATDYDLEVRRCSPGTFLLSRLLEDISALGIRRCDMAGELYDYKLSWGKEFLAHSQFCVYHRGLKSQLLYALRNKTLPTLGRPRPAEPPPSDPWDRE